MDSFEVRRLAFDRNFHFNNANARMRGIDDTHSGNTIKNNKIVNLNPCIRDSDSSAVPVPCVFTNENQKCGERERVGRKLFDRRRFGDVVQKSQSGIGISSLSKLQRIGIKRSYKSSFDDDFEFKSNLSSGDDVSPNKIYEFKAEKNVFPFPPSLFAYRQMLLIGVDQFMKNSVDYFSKLPDEMLLPILKMLSKQSLGRLAQSCKRFSKIVKDETLWRRIDVMDKVIRPGNAGVIIARNPDFLRMARAVIKEPSGLETLEWTNVPMQLIYLDLSSATIDSGTLNRLLGWCTRLRKLSLEQLRITPEILTTMEIFSGTINTLNMTMCSGLQAQALGIFLSKAKGLTALNLGCILPDWTPQDMEVMIPNIPIGMEFLNLAGFKNSMSEEHVKTLATRCPDLIDLDLSDCHRLTASSIEILLELKELQHLALSRCYRIEPVAFGHLSEMECLVCLEVFHLSQDGIETLEAALPGVQINEYQFSSVARPSFGDDRKCIWNQRVSF